MSDETLQLLKAFIDAAGYDITESIRFSETGVLADNKEPRYTVTKKKRKPRALAKSEGYSADFEHLWSNYPKGHGGNKQKAYKQFKARLEIKGSDMAGKYEVEYRKMIAGLVKYIEFIKATGQHVMHPATFLGRDKHYLNDFTIPDSAKRQNRVKQEWETIPENDNHLAAFIEKHGFKQGHDRMDKVFDTRRKLQAQIKQRIERELN